jgi:predicted glutamine amidotransferase
MCVIAYLPSGIKADKEAMENCFFVNPDGAGFMYQDKRHNKVIIKKGFMTFAKFWEEFSELPWNVDRVAHFRIATSGKVDEGCCHPFPVCRDYKEMRRLSNISKLAVAHNGIIHWTTPTDGMKSKFSDTMAFIANYVEPMKGFIFNPEIGDVIQHATNSKFAVMSYDKTIIIGNFEMYKGVFYSNDSYSEDYYMGLYKDYDYKWYENYNKDSFESKYPKPTTTKYLVDHAREQSNKKIAFYVPSIDWDLADELCVELERTLGIRVYDYLIQGKNYVIFEIDRLPIASTVYGYHWYETFLDEGDVF